MIEISERVLRRREIRKQRGLLMSGPYLVASFWVNPILNIHKTVRQSMVGAIDGKFIWRDRELAKTVRIKYGNRTRTSRST